MALCDDDLGQCIGQRAFETAADPRSATRFFVRRDEQQHAVVLGFLAELPGAEQLVGVRLDLLAFERSLTVVPTSELRCADLASRSTSFGSSALRVSAEVTFA